MKTNSMFTTAIGHLSDIMCCNRMSWQRLKSMSAIYLECAISAVSMMPDFIFSESCIPPKKKSDSVKKIKASDPCCLPPCQRVLQQKLLKETLLHMSGNMQGNPGQQVFGSDSHGWDLDDRRLKIYSVVYRREHSDAPSDIAIEESDYEDETDDETDAEEEGGGGGGG